MAIICSSVFFPTVQKNEIKINLVKIDNKLKYKKIRNETYIGQDRKYIAKLSTHCYSLNANIFVIRDC